MTKHGTGTGTAEPNEVVADRAAMVADHSQPADDYVPAKVDADVVLAGEPMVLTADEKHRLAEALKAIGHKIRDEKKTSKGNCRNWRALGWTVGANANVFDLRKVWSFFRQAKAAKPAVWGIYSDYPVRTQMRGSDWDGHTDGSSSIWIGWNEFATEAAKGGRGSGDRVYQANAADAAIIDDSLDF